MNALLLTDGYKTGHHQQYPQGTEEVYSNWTPRSNKYAPKGTKNYQQKASHGLLPNPVLRLIYFFVKIFRLQIKIRIF